MCFDKKNSNGIYLCILINLVKMIYYKKDMKDVTKGYDVNLTHNQKCLFVFYFILKNKA